MKQRSWTWLTLGLVGLGNLPESADAGAWSQPKGQHYIKISGIFYEADQHFNGDGTRESLGSLDEAFYADQGFLYVEYGARDRLTVIGQSNWGELRSENSLLKRSTRGLGDLGLGAKYQWLDGPVVLAPYVGLKIPLAYDTDDDPALGTGDADIEFKLLASRSLYPLPAYVGAAAGYRFRGGAFSNQLPYSLEVGGSPHARVFAKAYLSGTNTLIGDSGLTSAMNSMSMQVSEGDFVKWALNASVNVYGPLWADVLYEEIFAGKNVGAGRSLGFGFAWR